MNRFLSLILGAVVFGLGCLSAFADIPMLRPIYVVPVAFAALTFLALRRERPRQPYNSAIKRSPILMWLTLGLLSWKCIACTGIGAGITGQTPPSTPVKREGGTAVLIATRDLTRAETSPSTEVWGLYNVGNVARVTQQIAESGK